MSAAAWSPGARVNALLLTHSNDTLHVRSSITGFPRVGHALSTAGIGWEADLAWDETGDYLPAGSPEGAVVLTHAIRVPPPAADHHAESALAGAERDRAVAQVLADRNVNVLAYTAFYDPAVPGPVTKYRRVPGAPEPDRSGLLVCVDYGFDDGCWYFGHPEALWAVYAVLTECGVAVHTIEGDDVDSICVPSGDPTWRRGNARLAVLGYTLWEEVWEMTGDDPTPGRGVED